MTFPSCSLHRYWQSTLGLIPLFLNHPTTRCSEPNSIGSRTVVVHCQVTLHCATCQVNTWNQKTLSSLAAALRLACKIAHRVTDGSIRVTCRVLDHRESVCVRHAPLLGLLYRRYRRSKCTCSDGYVPQAVSRCSHVATNAGQTLLVHYNIAPVRPVITVVVVRTPLLTEPPL